MFAELQTGQLRYLQPTYKPLFPTQDWQEHFCMAAENDKQKFNKISFQYTPVRTEANQRETYKVHTHFPPPKMN